ncbi:hypothetical protein KKC94_04115 [Patescibacteria group bacterium]|nr:hypothetical protein [Patescibacteria group bacterium]
MKSESDMEMRTFSGLPLDPNAKKETDKKDTEAIAILTGIVVLGTALALNLKNCDTDNSTSALQRNPDAELFTPK